VRVSAKADYAVRAMIELAAATEGTPVKGEQLAEAQGIPIRFLENILGELRQQGLVQARRGSDGGYWLGREPREITVADVIRAVEGPLATVRGEGPEEIIYRGSAVPLQRVWVALQANIRDVLERVTLADLISGELPANVRERTAEPDLIDRT
jgi:Rrf2 family protein